MDTHSRIISKTKPKIRIVHIFAPEIIKTDVANFRDLVQRLTGKPTGTNKSTRRKESRAQQQPDAGEKAGIQIRFRRSDAEEGRRMEKTKDEGEIWVPSNSDAGFLGGFGDLDRFMQELGHHGFAPMGAANLPAYI